MQMNHEMPIEKTLPASMEESVPRPKRSSASTPSRPTHVQIQAT